MKALNYITFAAMIFVYIVALIGYLRSEEHRMDWYIVLVVIAVGMAIFAWMPKDSNDE